MSRAVVLGGGGPVGIGWEAGLIVGLAQAGVVLADADAVVGTSAGSVVGAQLAAGADLADALALLGAATTEPLDNQAGIEGLQKLMTLVAEVTAEAAPPEESRARIGRLALDTATLPEEQYLRMFKNMADVEWPEHFSCTAVDAESGVFQVWDKSAGADLPEALASSCAVPTVYPPVTIAGARYMDGGMRDMLNADVASGHDAILAISCTLLELPEGLADPAMESVLAGTRAQLDGLRSAGSKVEAVVPGEEFLDISGWGLYLMDFTRAGAAYEAGLRQAAVEAPRLSAFWAA